LFGVTVEAVTTSNVKGKKKIYKGKTGQRVNWKKAVVKVSEGQMIDATAS
jgi:large subunit ribosomal protein L23